MKTSDRILESLRRELEGFRQGPSVERVGTVVEVGDGIARVAGLSTARSSEMVEFEGGQLGVVLNLEEDSVGVMVLGDTSDISEGQSVTAAGRILDLPVGPALVGRVIDPLGRPLDGKGPITSKVRYPVEKVAPGVITRQSVNTPVQTGIKAIDALIPIGRGQRELIIGDRQTGKTAVAIDTMINQKGKNLTCVYVAIGQKESKVARLVAKLEEHGAMDHTVVVVAGASDPASLSFIAPYAGCAIGEEVMDRGQDALVVYDDLSRHAWAYRQVSLLLRRPPGREAYPGDVFYLHSRLLERAARMSGEHGGGSLTALPIIETQAGDISAYVPTNVISITDGQIYLESDLFYQGQRPALNVGLSVSRVGSSAQTKAMKKVAAKLRLDLAQYRALEAFAQFGSDLDETTRRQLELGRRTSEILKQAQYEPVRLGHQVAILYAVTNGLLDAVSVDRLPEFERSFRAHLDASGEPVIQAIEETGELSDQTAASLTKLVGESVAQFQSTRG